MKATVMVILIFVACLSVFGIAYLNDLILEKTNSPDFATLISAMLACSVGFGCATIMMIVETKIK